MNESADRSDRREASERGKSMMCGKEVRAALEKAIERAEQRSTQPETVRAKDSTSRAEVAIQKLREDRRLSREELDRPVTI